MRVMKPNKWMPVFLMAAVFFLAMAFTNCSDMNFDQGGDNPQKVDGTNGTQAVEVIDTTGVDDVPVTDENLPGLKKELNDRKKRGETEYVFTKADQCGPKKVIVCHVPPGNPANQHDICISVNALHAHVDRHGVDGHRDHIGSCKDAFKISEPEIDEEDSNDSGEDGDNYDLPHMDPDTDPDHAN